MTSKAKPKVDYVRMAYNGIRDMFLLNEVMPGQKLNYRNLSEKMNMSLTPVIQALKILEQEQLVRHIPNRGYFSEPYNPREIEDLYALRKIIEPALMPDVIANLSDEAANLIQSKYEAHKKLFEARDLVNRLRTDIDFHLTLAKISGRNTHYQTLYRIFDLLYLKYRAHYFTFANYKNAPGEHLSIVDSILQKNTRKAINAMRKHISRVEKYNLNSFSNSIAEQND